MVDVSEAIRTFDYNISEDQLNQLLDILEYYVTKSETNNGGFTKDRLAVIGDKLSEAISVRLGMDISRAKALDRRIQEYVHGAGVRRGGLDVLGAPEPSGAEPVRLEEQSETVQNATEWTPLIESDIFLDLPRYEQRERTDAESARLIGIAKVMV